MGVEVGVGGRDLAMRSRFLLLRSLREVLGLVGLRGGIQRFRGLRDLDLGRHP